MTGDYQGVHAFLFLHKNDPVPPADVIRAVEQYKHDGGPVFFAAEFRGDFAGFVHFAADTLEELMDFKDHELFEMREFAPDYVAEGTVLGAADVQPKGPKRHSPRYCAICRVRTTRRPDEVLDAIAEAFDRDEPLVGASRVIGRFPLLVELGSVETKANSRVRSSVSGTSMGSTGMSCGWGRSTPELKERNRRVPETRGERKLVTLLFTDLTGYTALAASLDPEEVFSFIRPTLADLQRVVEDHGGTVPQVQGDGFMAVFGVPVAHEDDAERAVRAALAVRERIRELNEGRSGLSIPEVHSGVNSGEVMVGPAPEASGIAVVGDVVNTASRLADLAPPGTVLVEERTWRRTRHAIRYGRRGAYIAKGKSEPVVAYEARAPRTSFPAGRASPLIGAEFVDREAQLERLSAEFLAVRKDRRARVVIVSGEAGAGKTRLASEFTKRHPDALVLAGRSTAYGTQVALSPLASAIGEIAGVAPGSATPSGRRRIQALAERVSTGDNARHVARGLALLFGLGERTEGHGARGTGDALDAARTVLEGLARERPVVVLLDDLHWADPAVVDALGSFRSHPWSGPILMVGITRTESLHRLKAQTRVELDAIPDDAMGELASLALGRKAFTPALRRVVTRAGGNPLFLEESLSMLVEAGALVSTATGWFVADPQMLDRVPTTVRAMIAARLDGLPPDEKRVLQCASVSGELTWDRLLERLAPGVDIPRVLRSMVSRDLLRRRRGSQARGRTNSSSSTR